MDVDGDGRMVLLWVHQAAPPCFREFGPHRLFHARLGETEYRPGNSYWSISDRYNLIEIAISEVNGLLVEVDIVASDEPVASFDLQTIEALPAQTGVPQFDRTLWAGRFYYYRSTGAHRLLSDGPNYLVELFAAEPRKRVDLASLSFIFDAADQLCAFLIRDITPAESAEIEALFTLRRQHLPGRPGHLSAGS